MRNGQNKRMRGRNRKGQNPLTRIYESNGPDVKIRGTASHIADKYVQLSRDAQASGDPVGAENYLQHAEHYFRMIAAAQEQFRQNQSYFRPDESRESNFEDVDEGALGTPAAGPAEVPPGGREHQPYPREAQPYPLRETQPYPVRESQPFGSRGDEQQSARMQPPAASRPGSPGAAERLPAFITGGGQPQPASYHGYGPNGFDGQPDRFPLHRRRRRRHGPRNEIPGASQGAAEASDEPESQPPAGPTSE
jgi:hypothetical protein